MSTVKETHTAAHLGTPWRDRKPPPSAPVWSIIQGYGNFFILVAAIELDVFNAIATSGPTTARALGETLRVSEPHLGSLLDGLVALGLLDCVRDRYELNETAERYLLSDSPASMAALVPVAPGPLTNWTRLADTIRNGTPSDPIDNNPASFYDPLVRATFATQLRAATRAGALLGIRGPARPRVLDLGAGGAPWTIAILTACHGATAVVNDLPGVINIASAKIREHMIQDRVELRIGDFHSIDIEAESYDIVLLGHVCRTEGEDGAQHLIRRAFQALRPEGRLLVADYFPDNTRKFNPFGVLMGVTMMANAVNGMTFTNERFHCWLADAGFRPIRLVEPIGFNHVYVATKPPSTTRSNI